MKIVYAVDGNISKRAGVAKKVSAMAKAWKNQGHEVYIVAYGERRIIHAAEDIEEEVPQSTPKNKWAFVLDLLQQYRYLRFQIARINPEIVYGRYPFPLWFPEKAYGLCSPFVLEINTDDTVEYGLKSNIKGYLNQLFRRRTISSSSGLVFVTDELKNGDAFRFFKGKNITIGNPCLNASELSATPQKDEIVFGFAGTPGQEWQGVDKILHLAHLYKKAKFEIVGPNEEELLRKGIKIPGNVYFLGYMTGKALERRVKTWDIGLCTLALHRKKMKDACPLKSRAYLQQGLPIIYAYNDPDLVGDEPFALKIGNHEDNVIGNFRLIEEFAQKIKGDKEVRNAAYRFAKEKLSIEAKEQVRLSFLTQLLIESRLRAKN